MNELSSRRGGDQCLQTPPNFILIVRCHRLSDERHGPYVSNSYQNNIKPTTCMRASDTASLLALEVEGIPSTQNHLTRLEVQLTSPINEVV